MRLRVVLYLAAASALVAPFLTTWSPWVAVVTFAPMLGVVLLLSPALGGTRRHVLILRVSGALGCGCAAVGLGLALAGHAVGALASVAGLASLIWNVLAPRAQRDDNRFRRATVKYGILALVLPVVLTMAGTTTSWRSPVSWPWSGWPVPPTS
ncbi:hypothetical protein ACWCSD_22955 [Nonomuraea sp. NPDC001684]